MTSLGPRITSGPSGCSIPVPQALEMAEGSLCWQQCIQHSRKALEPLQSSSPCLRYRAPDGGGSPRAAGVREFGIWYLAGQGLVQLLEDTGIYAWQSIPNPCGIPTGGDLPSSPHCKSHTSRTTDPLEIHEAKREAGRRMWALCSSSPRGLCLCLSALHSFLGVFCSYLKAISHKSCVIRGRWIHPQWVQWRGHSWFVFSHVPKVKKFLVAAGALGPNHVVLG